MLFQRTRTQRVLCKFRSLPARGINDGVEVRVERGDHFTPRDLRQAMKSVCHWIVKLGSLSQAVPSMNTCYLLSSTFIGACTSRLTAPISRLRLLLRVGSGSLPLLGLYDGERQSHGINSLKLRARRPRGLSSYSETPSCNEPTASC